jgi:hypothetical protein
MKNAKATSKKGRPQIVRAYQTNPYAVQRRNAAATAAPPELVPVIVQPAPRRRRTAKVVQQAKQRLTDKQFLGELGLAAAGAGVGAIATGWAASHGLNPWAMGGATLAIGGAGALGLPGAWRGAGIGVAGWGFGQLIATGMHAIKELRLQKAKEQQQAIEQQRATEQQRALEAAAQKALPPASKPSNAFMPAISDAFSNARTYGHYGRADDEERMTDLDLVLG